LLEEDEGREGLNPSPAAFSAPLASDSTDSLPRDRAGTRPASVAIIAGALAASVVALLLLPSQRLPPGKLLLRSALWMLATLLAGISAMALSRRLARAGCRPFRVDALETAAAWLLLPPLFLLAARSSPWTAVLAALVTGILALCLRGMIPVPLPILAMEPPPGPQFAELPPPDSGRGQALAIAVCLEMAAVLALRRDLLPETLLIALASFLFIWKFRTMLLRARGETMSRPVLRSAAAAVLALLIIVPLSLLQMLRMGPGPGATDAAQRAARKPHKGTPAREDAGDAWRGIILFTVPKKEILVPPLAQNTLHPAGFRKPLIIPFDGAYWYFQAPQQGPGLHPHLAHGDPVKVSIYSTGWIPLAMQAHQALPQPVDLRDCGAMQVTVENGDNRPGRIDMGVLLTDKSLPGKPSVFLGAKPIPSTQPGRFAFKAVPIDENVTFSIPPRLPLRRFDDITVFFFPAAQRATLGTRVGIQQFTMDPR
jgi:hypothetical protein